MPAGPGPARPPPDALVLAFQDRQGYSVEVSGGLWEADPSEQLLRNAHPAGRPGPWLWVRPR